MAKHPWPGRCGSNPCAASCSGPADISKGPTTVFARGKGVTCTPVVNEVGCVIVVEGLNGAEAKCNGFHGVVGNYPFFVASDGLVASPLMLDDRIILANAIGCACALTMTEGFPVAWLKKFCGACPRDTWSVAGHDGLLIMCGIQNQPEQMDMLPPADHVYALDAATGDTKWSVKMLGMPANFCPCFDGNTVMYTDITGGVQCLKLKTGAAEWSLKGEGSMMSRALGGAVALDGVVYQTYNMKAKKAWNAPHGGKGAVRALEARKGQKKWEATFDLEANSLPTVCPKGPGDQPVLVLGLGSNCGNPPPAAPSGDEWKGRVVALDLSTGDVKWSFEPEPHTGPLCAGASVQAPYRANAWSPPSCAADGTVYISWHGGTVFVLNGASGELLSKCQIGSSSNGALAICPGILIFASHQVCAIWDANATAEAAATVRVEQPLARPFAESGTEHFYPCRVGQKTDRPYQSKYSAPLDLTKPAWCYPVPDRPDGVWNLGCPCVDAQRNIYFGPQRGGMFVLRPDGTLRGHIDTSAELSVVNCVLAGPSLFFLDTAGQLHSHDLETLERNWAVRFCLITVGSGMAMTFFGDTLLVPGGRYDGNEWSLHAINASDGSIRWSAEFTKSGYNTFPQVLEDGSAVICGTQHGGLLALSMADGSVVSEVHPPYESFSTGGPTVGPGGMAYVASNHPQTGEGYARGSVRAIDVRKKEIRWDLQFDLPCTQVPNLVPKEFTDGSGGDIVVVGLGWQLCGEGGDQHMLKHYGSIKAKLVGFDSGSGKERWSFAPPALKTGYPAGGSDGDIIPPDAWSNGVVDARGTLYVCWQGGVIFAIEGGTGKVLSRYELGSVSNGSPAIAPGMLTICAFDRVICWRDPELEEAWRAANGEDPRAATPLLPLRGPGAEEDACKVPRNPRARDPPQGGAGGGAVDLKTQGGEDAIWVVVGGGDKGGIVVRNGEGLKSPELGRISTGARIRESEKKGDRLHYAKVSGDGPDFGWVSLTFKGAPLVRPE